MTITSARTDQQIRLLIVDDHTAVRQGLGLLLAPEGISVCAEANSSGEALAALENTQPHLAIVDLSLGGEDGLALVAELQAQSVPVLVYSMHEDAGHVHRAFAAGALGYVTKRELHPVLVQAVREVAARRRFVSPVAALALTDYLAGGGSSAETELSVQEMQVFRLLGEGRSTGEIAGALEISARTVESYYARIQDKLGLDGMHALRRRAIASYHV